MRTNNSMAVKSDNLIIWEVMDGSGEVQQRSLDRANAVTFAKVLRRHLSGRYTVKPRVFVPESAGIATLACRRVTELVSAN